MTFRHVYDGERLVGLRCASCSALVSRYFRRQHRCTDKAETLQLKRLRCWESVFPSGVQEGLCPCCHGTRIRYSCTNGSTFQQMHIVAKSAGGVAASWNLVPGCGCNQQMLQHNLIDWMGTRGNKRQLLRPLMLRKYKSLVAPVYRTRSRAQLVDWVARLYSPQHLNQYREWLLLLDNEVDEIFD